MRNKAINVVGGEAISRQQLFANLAHFSDRVFENCTPVLMDEMHLFIHSVVRRGMQAAAGGHVQRAPSRAINLVQEINDSRAVFRGLEDDRSSPIAEQNAGGAVGVIEDGGHYIGPNH